jgi:squalene-associated FAD-dependent desaturase
MASKQVVIVGGGVSGLAAGVFLTERGVPVTLLEQKLTLGGRAYSFQDAETGDIIDNGQHVLIAGYERTLQFLRTIGTLHLLSIRPFPILIFHHPQKGFRRFQLPRLPTPLHFILGFLQCDLLSFLDRWRALGAGRNIRNTGADDSRATMTVEQWLDSVGQSTESRRSFWRPIAVSMMNENPDTAPALPFVRSMRKAFLGNWRNACLGIPNVGLSQLYVEGSQEYIGTHGGKIRCGADVVEVLFEGSLVKGVRLRDGSEVECRGLILAVPPYRIKDLLPDAMVCDPPFSGIHSIQYSPIISTHLWFEKDFMDHEFVGLIDRRTQWIFNRRRISKESGIGGHVSAVISAAYDFVGHSNDELVQISVEDIRSVYPALAAGPTHSVVIREKRATFSLTPRTEYLRPSQETPVPNLFLAGDWTSTGYPATIESAVISGERCAHLVSRLFQDQSFV